MYLGNHLPTQTLRQRFDDGILQLGLLEKRQHLRRCVRSLRRDGRLEQYARVPWGTLQLPIPLRHFKRPLRVVLQLQSKARLLAPQSSRRRETREPRSAPP